MDGMTGEQYWEWRAAMNAWLAERYRQPYYTDSVSSRRKGIKDAQDTVVYCLMRARQSALEGK